MVSHVMNSIITWWSYCFLILWSLRNVCFLSPFMTCFCYSFTQACWVCYLLPPSCYLLYTSWVSNSPRFLSFSIYRRNFNYHFLILSLFILFSLKFPRCSQAPSIIFSPPSGRNTRLLLQVSSFICVENFQYLLPYNRNDIDILT